MDSVAMFQVGGFTEHLPNQSPHSKGKRLTEVSCENDRPEQLPSNMDSTLSVQVGGFIEHPPISPLSLRERVRVRGF
jgi:hypothetical protein